MSESGAVRKRLGLLYGGTFPERRVLDDPRFAPWFSQTIYLPDLDAAALADLDGLYVPEGTNHRRLQAASAPVSGFLERGGTVLVFGDHPVSWIPNIRWEFRPALADPRLKAGGPDLGYHEAVPLIDQIWHHHGILRAPAGAQTLLATEDGADVLYLDRVSTRGTILATTLDPLRHTGETLQPLATRYLERFLPWVVNVLL
ncbi:MAG: hypothetical protein IT306_02155 [Chloroflexi bacterium]|nr:hypothetical protein [Chloroflexota bacterium]